MSFRRWFDERQVRVALELAAKRQDVSIKVPRQPRGLSMDGLVELGKELGLAPEQVAAAIVELDESDRIQEPFHWFGTTPAFELHRSITGRVSDEAWSEIVHESRKSLGVPGHETRAGAARELIVKESLMSMQVSLTDGDGHTTLSLRTQRTGQLLLIWVFSLAGVLLSGGGLGKLLSILKLPTALMLSFCFGLIVLLMVMVRALVSAWARKDRRKLADLLAHLEGIATRPEQAAVAAPAKDGATVM